MNNKEVSCPVCQKKIIWSADELWRPFCSERCQLIDLGKWADGSHAIAGEELVNPDLDHSASELNNYKY